jgi:lipoprotein-anchoring transpeptidase ErfK/SrfK
MRTLLTVAALLVLVSEPAWAESYFQSGSPSARQYYLPPTYQYFTPPPRANRRAQPKAAIVQIPQPEKAAIAEEYAKGSIVIVNHERNLYFVEETGQAIRYPVAIGKPNGRACKQSRPSAKTPPGIRRRKSSGNPTSHPLSRQGLKIRSGLGRSTSATRYTEFTGQTGPAQSAARFRMAAFACTTLTSSNCTKKYKSEPTFTWCLD